VIVSPSSRRARHGRDPRLAPARRGFAPFSNQAHEDDAERAARAALELVAAAVSSLKTHAALQTRVGIATGLVVVGDLIGSGEAQERGIVGETPNLAALWGDSSPGRSSC
jgi:class 3 adenylate cyclase